MPCAQMIIELLHLPLSILLQGLAALSCGYRNFGSGHIKLITCLSSEKFEKIGEGGEAFFLFFYFFG